MSEVNIERTEKDDKRFDMINYRIGETFFKGVFLDVMKAISNFCEFKIIKFDCFLTFSASVPLILFSFEFLYFQINHHSFN